MNDLVRPVTAGARRRSWRPALLHLAGVLVLVAGCANAGSPVTVPAPTTPPLGVRETAYDPPRPAPALRLTDQEGRPFDLASLRGTPALVFFGYTHCPDVCPTTLADVRDALKLVDGPVNVVFVTVDPARDDAAAMKQYVDYYQSGFVGLTGTEDEIRAAADAWGVSYAKVDTGSASGYTMAHTADAFLVDADGMLRHKIWFGAGPEVIAARVNGLPTEVVATAPPAAVASPTPIQTPTQAPDAAETSTPSEPSPSPAIDVRARLETTVVRAGSNRIVVTVSDPSNREVAKPDIAARFTFRSTDDPAAPPIEVPGSFIWIIRGGKAAYVAQMDLPRAGAYTGTIILDGPEGRVGAADFAMTAREQSPTPQLGSAAPSVRTPIATDVGGNLRLISTDVYPDPRFYEHSVDELLAAGKPFVFTLYSPAFCPTTACGPLLSYMKEIADEFPEMTFVHAEPYVMRDLGGRIQPEYEGNQFAWASWSKAYGIPVEPYVFVVGADGRVVTTFELIMGSDEMRTAIRAALGE